MLTAAGELDMKKKLILCLVAVASVALLASGATGADVFFSNIGGVGQGVVPMGNIYMTGYAMIEGTSVPLYIWATDDQDYDTTIGMNVLSSNSAAVALIGGEVANPEIFSEALGAPIDNRWQDASVGNVAADQISNMNAARVTSGTGVLGANDGTMAPFKNLDTLYDIDAGAFLLATVTMTTSTELSFGSTLTINQEGTALFVNAGVQVFPDFIPVILGVPEPSTFVLVAFGLIAMLGYGLKRY
jgi:hypothetical protein